MNAKQLAPLAVMIAGATFAGSFARAGQDGNGEKPQPLVVAVCVQEEGPIRIKIGRTREGYEAQVDLDSLDSRGGASQAHYYRNVALRTRSAYSMVETIVYHGGGFDLSIAPGVKPRPAILTVLNLHIDHEPLSCELNLRRSASWTFLR